MKHLIAAAAIALSGMAAPVLAQDLATMSCADFGTKDNAGQMAMMAELDSLNKQSGGSVEMSSVELNAKLHSDCTANPDMLVIDAWKKIKGM